MPAVPSATKAASDGPKPDNRRARRLWRTETEMTFNALGYEIGTASKTRPPQLPRREKPGPRIRGIDPPKAWPWPDWLPGAQGYW